MNVLNPGAFDGVAVPGSPGAAFVDDNDEYVPPINASRRRRGGVRGWLWASLTASLQVMLLISILTIVGGFYLFNRIVVVVPAGHVGVLYCVFFGGTQVDEVYPEGIHIIAPWDYMTMYDARVTLALHKLDVLTNRGLPLELDLAIRYHPEFELVGLLQRAVGQDYLEKVVIPQVESVLRRNIGQHDPEDIYTNKEGILTTIIKKAIEETSQKYITIDDIIIRQVHLPADIVAAIDQKLVSQQRAAEYEYRLASERAEVTRKQIEASGIRDYQKVIAETLSDQMLKWQGIQATQELAKSSNTKVVVIGGSEHGLPLILGDK